MNRKWTIALTLFVLAAIAAGSSAEPYRGNTQSRVFHQSSCQHYMCPNCTVTFKTVQEAIDKGFRACRLCKPGTQQKNAVVDAAYVGNTRTRKFHKGSCHYAGCPNCTAKFRSRGEAIEAGYVPGKCCKP